MSQTSLALRNLRAFTILLVVAFHSVLAYLAWQPAVQAPFDSPPYAWRAIPILDHVRWPGFDLFCALQYIYLMPFMFFLSGLFVWPSLVRKGTRTFLYDRALRLGVPFVAAVYLLMPLAHYPVYRVTARDPSWAAFWAHWTALPFWPTGPLWFLWQLLVLDFVAAALYGLAPRLGGILNRRSASLRDAPTRYAVDLVVVSALAYVPLAFVFTPWHLTQYGPFAFQPSRFPHYAVYFLAGVGIGSHGIERGLLRPDGRLARQWRAWLGGALVAFVSWMIATGLTLKGQWAAGSTLFAIVPALLFVVTSAAACLGLLAAFLRFAARPWRLAGHLSDHAYGIYLIHYPFVVWLQFLLLGWPLPAIAKAAVVFTGALGLSWSASVLLGQLPGSARLMRAERRVAPGAR